MSVVLGGASAHNCLGLQHIALVPTSWGTCGVAWRELGRHGEAASGAGSPCIDAALVRIVTPGLGLISLRQALLRTLPGADEIFPDAHGRFHPTLVPLWFGELMGYLQGYYSNSLRPAEQAGFVDVWGTWRPRLDLGALTEFQQRVLQIVAQIPRGVCRSYGEVARLAGRPGAARAVGAALRCNPFPVLIPCHRVLGTGGKLTGFTAPGGIAAKKKMLELEGAMGVGLWDR